MSFGTSYINIDNAAKKGRHFVFSVNRNKLVFNIIIVQTEYQSILGELQVINSAFEELGGNPSALKIFNFQIVLIFAYHLR